MKLITFVICLMIVTLGYGYYVDTRDADHNKTQLTDDVSLYFKLDDKLIFYLRNDSSENTKITVDLLRVLDYTVIYYGEQLVINHNKLENPVRINPGNSVMVYEDYSSKPVSFDIQYVSPEQYELIRSIYRDYIYKSK